MIKKLVNLALFLCYILLVLSIGSQSNNKEVPIRGHNRKGTYVKPHSRTITSKVRKKNNSNGRNNQLEKKSQSSLIEKFYLWININITINITISIVIGISIIFICLAIPFKKRLRKAIKWICKIVRKIESSCEQSLDD